MKSRQKNPSHSRGPHADHKRRNVLSLGVWLFCFLFAVGGKAEGSLWLKRGFQTGRLPEIPKESSPEFPEAQVALAIRFDIAKKSFDVQKTLETILHQTYFEGHLDPDPKTGSLGHVKSVKLTRDLMYVLYGRALFEEKRPREAKRFLTAVNKDSPLWVSAQIQTAWCDVALSDFGSLEERLKTLEPLVKTDRPEWELLRAVEFVETARPLAAYHMAGKIKGLTGELEALRLKVSAQAGFQLFLLEKDPLNRRKWIDGSLASIDQVALEYRDSEVAYFAGETWWNRASFLRIQDPLKNKSEVDRSLKNAEGWLGPWMDRVVKERKPLLQEQAMFLAAVIAWERKDYARAIPRLQVIPEVLPKTEYKDDIYQLVADHFFEKQDFERALVYYGRLANNAKPEKAAYGIYKAAWAFYNQKKKFSALRHLERLLVFYRRPENRDTPDPGNLSKEAEKDMLLVLAELVDAQKAQQELQIFKYSKEEGYLVREELAETFGKIGRFEEGARVYENLLKENPQNPVAARWLGNLMTAYLSIGRRDMLAKSLDTHFSKITKGKEDLKDLEEKVVKFNLTLHRESKKTDDPAYWAATDALYQEFEKYFPQSSAGDVWYFGAQRHEQQKRLWKAVEWYKRAASLKTWDNHLDAALSSLRIARNVADLESLKKERDPKMDEGLRETAFWYLSEFPLTPQARLAENLYLESLFELSQYDLAHQHLVKISEDPEFQGSRWNSYLSYNKRLYDRKLWVRIFKLSSDLLKKTSKEEHVKLLKEFRQESAFQKAFTLETDKSEGAEEWYRTVLDVTDLRPLRYKAWHNLLVLLDKNGDAFKEEQKVYEKFLAEDRENLSFEETSLLGNAIQTINRRFDEKGMVKEQAIALRQLSTLAEEKERAEGLLWESVRLAGAFGEISEMEESWKQLGTSQLATNPDYLVILARNYFWSEKYSDAQKTLSLIKGEWPVSAWLLLRDISARKDRDDYPDRPEFVALKAKEELSLLEKFVEKLKEGRSPAGSEDEPVAELKRRLGRVSAVISEGDEKKKTLFSWLKGKTPQIAVESICEVPKVSKQTAEDLSALSTPPVALPQWAEFLKRLALKVDEFRAQEKKEQALCEEKRDEVALLDPVRKTNSPFCDARECFPDSFSDSKAKEMFLKTRGGKIGERVFHLMSVGAFSVADYLVTGTEDKGERTYGLALLRLGMGDWWAASSLFKELQKDPFYKDEANLWLSKMAARKGREKVARNLASQTNVIGLDSWEAGLYRQTSGK